MVRDGTARLLRGRFAASGGKLPKGPPKGSFRILHQGKFSDLVTSQGQIGIKNQRANILPAGFKNGFIPLWGWLV